VFPLLMAAPNRNDDEAVIAEPAPNLAILHRRSITPVVHRD
jgi:hypothetical protein